jgi:hypothetical protein
VLQEDKGSKVLRVPQRTLDLLGHQGQLAHRVLKDHREHPVLQDHPMLG